MFSFLIAVFLCPGGHQELGEESLKDIRVVSWYQSITDYKVFDRTIDDVVKHLKETKTQLAFRVFWRWLVIPEECEDPKCDSLGRSYEHLEEAVQRIKEELPDILLCGAVPCERINAEDKNDITGDILDRDSTWALALDPGEHGVYAWGYPPESKINFQADRARLLGYAPPGPYNPNTAYAYYPDVTNPDFQKLLLSWIKRQVNAGVDAIWIDMLFAQARLFAVKTENPRHPAVEEAYRAACAIIDSIHAYAKSKNRRVFVGTWNNFLEIDTSYYPSPDVDFITVIIWEEELWDEMLYPERWNTLVKKVRGEMGNNVLVIPFMDEATVHWEDQPLGIFSQHYDSETQKRMLCYMDSFFVDLSQKENFPIVFMYPLHGGWMGSDASVLSFGKFKVYDALAPEFQTYETIKELANEKTGIEERKRESWLFSPQVYPNPFSKNTTIYFKLSNPTFVKIDVYDITGKKIERVFGGFLSSGEHSIIWVPRNLPSGVYFFLFQTEKNSKILKGVLK